MKFGIRTPSLKKHSKQEQQRGQKELLRKQLFPDMEEKAWDG